MMTTARMMATKRILTVNDNNYDDGNDDGNDDGDDEDHDNDDDDDSDGDDDSQSYRAWLVPALGSKGAAI